MLGKNICVIKVFARYGPYFCFQDSLSGVGLSLRPVPVLVSHKLWGSFQALRNLPDVFFASDTRETVPFYNVSTRYIKKPDLEGILNE